MNCMIQNANNNSYIQVSNNGWYLAEFVVTYISNGQRVQIDSGMFAIGQTRRIDIEPGTTEVHLKLDIWIFGGDRVMYDDNINVSSPRCFNLTGTIFTADIEEIDCPQLGNPPTNNCCCNCCNHCCNCCKPCQTHCSSYNYYNYHNC